ncbi:hypothetical protein PISMIDRAFT_356063 [Pisolithus microcarpus 441]|uniref:F-box domain-containing protein n=1 Tax=Pisolithus microcarpus 441 TaxID=765257 RepID=A0A0C9ZGT5_9AGAM|nr:hypothetical protein BKA83DRAFT_356063 [Pisolithus microcarpus]KIK25214.1 hypothetical protein PISMIDRAFT_356063 [Pisolithus microcarpus 441]
MLSLSQLPQEVLEHVAYFAATRSPVGPPLDLPLLLRTCRNIYRRLSFENNPLLYARIFSSKFDSRAPLRRLGSSISLPRTLANELRKRFTYLKLIRAGVGARVQHQSTEHDESSGRLRDLLWLAYLMMLENDGKNERQLKAYANMETWLIDYWFDDMGASLASYRISRDQWPMEDENNSLAMWLLWFLVRQDSLPRSPTSCRALTSTLKLTALAANRYAICEPSWAEFTLESGATATNVTHFSETYFLVPPSLAPAAILAYFTFALWLLSRGATNVLPQAPSSLPLDSRESEDWDADWQRCINLARPGTSLALSYAPGSLEGIWEGLFTYTDFDVYSSLLSGGLPPVLRNCEVVQHRQTWRLREYHLLSSQESLDKIQRLELGDALRAFFPSSIRLRELSESLEVCTPGMETIHYQRSSHTRTHQQSVGDIIVIGEGHSAWGQFNLYGRVRPLDGLLSLLKEYCGGHRGRWLYRGFLLGNHDGHLSGRWRDALSPSHVEGYEGCFVMSRRH